MRMKWFVRVEFFKDGRQIGEIAGKFDARSEASAKNKVLKTARDGVFKKAKHEFKVVRPAK